jgi:hypothetical protein
MVCYLCQKQINKFNKKNNVVKVAFENISCKFSIYPKRKKPPHVQRKLLNISNTESYSTMIFFVFMPFAVSTLTK